MNLKDFLNKFEEFRQSLEQAPDKPARFVECAHELLQILKSEGLCLGVEISSCDDMDFVRREFGPDVRGEVGFTTYDEDGEPDEEISVGLYDDGFKGWNVSMWEFLPDADNEPASWICAMDRLLIYFVEHAADPVPSGA